MKLPKWLGGKTVPERKGKRCPTCGRAFRTRGKSAVPVDTKTIPIVFDAVMDGRGGY